MRSLAKDSPDKTYSLRYPTGGCKSIYTLFVDLLGEQGKRDAVQRISPFLAQHGLLLIDVNGSPQAVRITDAVVKENND